MNQGELTQQDLRSNQEKCADKFMIKGKEALRETEHLFSYYTKQCKENQSKGGKGEKIEGKGLKTSTLIAKKTDISEELIKYSIYVIKNAPELIPLVKSEEISLYEAGTAPLHVEDGKLSTESEKILEGMRVSRNSSKKAKNKIKIPLIILINQPKNLVNEVSEYVIINERDQGRSIELLCSNRIGQEKAYSDQEGVIYRVTDPDGKQYYGKSQESLKTRKGSHNRSHPRTAFDKALRKYGDALIWEPVAYITDDALLNDIERIFIEYYDTRKNGYNVM